MRETCSVTLSWQASSKAVQGEATESEEAANSSVGKIRWDYTED